ncbi:MAG: SMP-30/gluconolactonase/LRE family protein [Paludisphaera borealis]|uniref:SMP-30/gluconolactonase/LRE family protein n=1 Tax=Paludisphaera borealis TaxID=1387353 RepID=UPI00284CF30B|nr:SMP-30/gluconolactonase/LRE family protein [Paludisphaera borealis]MDR3619198.1 SMP-30/gluconolactonase/LRE family protein [Paludisphaera borealis]
MKTRHFAAMAFSAGLLLTGADEARAKDTPTLGKIERLDPKLDAIIPPDGRIERVAEGFDWSEGTVWDAAGSQLLFSDVPLNIVHRWTKGQGTGVLLKPSGYTGSKPRGGEPGSNGLTFDHKGRLVLCQHGDRRIARLESDGSFATLADRYDGKRFSSPNDGVFKSNGDYYFTDPPYGLLKLNDDPAKEIPFNGVYRVKPDGSVTLLTKELTFPNGIAFSPDEKTLYVANSDPKRAVWTAYPVKEDGTIGEGRVFADVTSKVGKENPGLPDGMKVDVNGNVFATGPGGVFIFSSDGTHLGTLNTGEATGNCAFGEDGSVLYIASDMYIGRVQLKTKGLIPGVRKP